MEVMEVMVRCKGEALASRCMFEPVPSEKLGPVYRYACLFVSLLSPSPLPQGAIEGQPALGETEALFDTSREWYNFW